MIVQFHDGTTVRILTLQDKLEVTTKYGKLAVPTADVRRIEFGLHTPADIAKKVEEAMTELESSDFSQREEAGKRLVTLGRYAYPALVKASKGSNLETTRRVQGLLKSVRDKYPAYQLKMTDNDLIHTREFTIAGKIESPVIKARTEHFGDAQLKLSELRAMRTAAANDTSEISVDAAKYGSNPNTWMETEYNVTPDGKLLITAEGSVDVYAQNPGQYISGPAGNAQIGQRGMYVPGVLLGRIGENGPIFVVGARSETTPNREGKLFLHIWPFQGGAAD
jgi:flagellin-specific chaperone FliS